MKLNTQPASAQPYCRDKRYTCLLAAAILLALSGCAPVLEIAAPLSRAEGQANLMVSEANTAIAINGNLVSPRTLENGTLKMVASRDWTSGFFAGELWYLYALTGKDSWLKAAQRFTAPIDQEKLNGTTHDMGFKVYCSFGNGYKATGDLKYKEVIVQAAKTLSTRFNPAVGALRSWDHHQEQWNFPVIIDNMLNLELLFEATKFTGDSSFYKIAVRHANTTMKNHFRDDFSTWHVVSYNPVTGAVEKKQTHQGFSDSSAWARGQAWALYGYTMCYRETRDPAYLKQAEKVATFLLNHKNMPADLVPYWDFNAPEIPHEPRDVSAAAIIASALYELAGYSGGQSRYRKNANRIMMSIEKKYTAERGGSKGFILVSSTGSRPVNSEVNVPLIYADYYYLEALMRSKKRSR